MKSLRIVRRMCANYCACLSAPSIAFYNGLCDPGGGAASISSFPGASLADTPISGGHRGRLGGGSRERSLLLPACLLFLSAPLRNILSPQKRQSVGSRYQLLFTLPPQPHYTPEGTFLRGPHLWWDPSLVNWALAAVRNAISSEVRVLALQV